MDELLAEMRSDVTRLPNELGKLKGVSNQLKMDEISTISKLAKGGAVSTPAIAAPTQSVITQAPALNSTVIKKERSEVIVAKKNPEGSSANKITTMVHGGSKQAVKGTHTIQIPTGSQIVQTADGLILYSGATTTGSKTMQTSTVAQTAPSSSASNQQAYTLGVPAAYMGSNSSGIYQAVQFVPVSAGSSQQLVYWPTAQSSQVSGVPVGSQLAVVQDPKAVQTIKQLQQQQQQQQHSGTSGTTPAGKPTASGKPGGSIITID